jgi:hypothetical protein
MAGGNVAVIPAELDTETCRSPASGSPTRPRAFTNDTSAGVVSLPQGNTVNAHASSDRRAPAIDALIREAEAAASDQSDPLAALVHLIKLIIESETDAYLLTGVLVEGIAVTVARRLPDEKQGEVATEALRLLRDRCRAYGVT